MCGSVSEIILQANLRVDLIDANLNTGGTSSLAGCIVQLPNFRPQCRAHMLKGSLSLIPCARK
jgi:hypothetical protein